MFADLMPALEEQIQAKLDPLLRDALSATKRQYLNETGRDPDEAKLFKLTFWLLTAKVFHDRKVKGFASLGPDAEMSLKAVGEHYGSGVPALLTRAARQVAAERIWSTLDFRNLSVEVLSHIWSTTLIDPETKARLDHATLRRGLEWNEALTARGKETGNRGRFVKGVPTAGYILGVAPRTTFDVFQVPEMSYLSAKPEHQRLAALEA